MTTFNTGYNKTELLDHELEAVTGGKTGMQRFFELPDSALTPQQREWRERLKEMGY
jgi:hypothetical protein